MAFLLSYKFILCVCAGIRIDRTDTGRYNIKCKRGNGEGEMRTFHGAPAMLARYKKPLAWRYGEEAVPVAFGLCGVCKIDERVVRSSP